MMNKWIILLLLLPMAAWPCFTSQRAIELGKQHPDIDFESMAHHMHAQQRVEYQYKGPAGCIDGVSDIFPCSGIELAGWLELPELGGGSGADSWGWKDEQTDRYFALMGRSNGVAFVEVTDPANPVYLGNLPRPAGVQNSVWTDIKTYQNHVFVVADDVIGHGIQVFDLTRLREIKNPPVTFTMDAHYTQFDYAHNIFINPQSGFAYAVGSGSCAGGLHMVDIRTPSRPEFAGCFSADGYTHDVQCVLYQGPDERFTGREICFASNEDSVTVVDVTEKSEPVLIGRHTYNTSAYTHQGWLTEDQRFFVTDDELDETTPGFGLQGTRTLIFDLQTLDQATAPAEYIANGLSIDHNQYVVRGFTFQANYRRGLRVLRIDNPASAQLTEVAWFDTYPAADGLGFSGAWNVYPFFDNGTLLVSDINRGLFVLRVTEPDVLQTLTGSTDTLFADGFEA
ncbi:MAG: choice-of-anchor B family protein [Symploca sp. SIO2G7]|nr:choice-of-anchor B family protein [Symploca sp. SIO2G7]